MDKILESSARAGTSASAKLPPGPPGYPLVGIVPSLLRDPLPFLSDVGRQYSDVARLNIGPKDIFLLNHPDLIQRALREESDKYVRSGGVWEVLSLLFGRGLAVTDGEAWKHQRRLIQPQFRQKHLAGLVPIMTGAIARELTTWRGRAGSGERVDLAAEMNRFSMSVFLTAMFGTVITPEEARIAGEAMSVGLAHVQTRMLFHWLPSWMPVPGGEKFRRSMRSLDTIVRALIRQREQEPGSDDLLALLLAARSEDGAAMSPEVLRDEVLTFFIAGSETTATAMIWTLALLCQHGEVESRLREELRSVLGGRDPRYEDLPKLVYTHQVIQESMRLYPPVWIIVRQATEDGRLGGYLIPKQSFVAVLPHIVHRHRDFWSEPEVFNPDRFAGGRAASKHGAAYMPFGAGPHQCIGNNFALIEATLMLTMILQRFVLKMPVGYRAKPVLVDTMRPAGGLPVTLEVEPQGVIKALLKLSGAVVPSQLELELSHHYGLEKFRETGSAMITVINREYCKRLVLMLPGQSHPEHWHKLKDETFHLLHGSIELVLDGVKRTWVKNDVIVIPREAKHEFRTEHGTVIEEISSTHIRNDSGYSDPTIGENSGRKTYITNWMD